MYLNGICFLFDQNLQFSRNFTPGYQECSSVAMDIVFLIDGSGSIARVDFTTMKNFIKSIIDQFKDKNTQFSLVQYSKSVDLQFDFNQFLREKNVENLLMDVIQMRSQTYTPSGIKFVAEKVFEKEKGARENAVKLLITITDGESNDQDVSFDQAIAAADRRQIIRYAIGVRLGLV
ncbi:integrin alpha-X-like [Latimeria chalumnae]|uniref:integrin alpha-X-like n=1 Tax=Latimeria chalumnae TaxID=7897 RepID=UPI00313DAE92